MKKKINSLVAYFEKKKAAINAKIASNALTDEERTDAEQAMQEIGELITALQNEDDDETILSRLDEVKEKIDALVEKINARRAEPAPAEARNYLKTNNAVRDWLQAIRASNGKNDGGAMFARMWREKLATNGISIEEGSELAYMPEIVKGRIEDAWNRDNNWLRDLTHTGAKVFAARYNASDQDAETSRAKGHLKGETKAEQELEMGAKTFMAKFVYKLMGLDNETIYENDSALIDYITGELYDQFLYECRRAILVGDGRLISDPYKISSFESYLRDTADGFVAIEATEADTALIDTLVEATNSVVSEAQYLTLFISKTDLNTLRRYVVTSESTPQYITKEMIAEMIGVGRIITTDLLGDDAKAIIADLRGYSTVGNLLNPSFVEWEDYKTNKKYFRIESAVGGGVAKPKSAVIVVEGEGD